MLLLLGLLLALQFQAKVDALPGSNCPERCGDVEIVYPFGIGADCAMEGFKLKCNKTEDNRGNVTLFSNMPVLNISLVNSQVRMKNYISYMCINRWRTSTLDLSDTPFTFSEQLNKFTVIGVNTLAYLSDSTVSYLYIVSITL